MSMIFFTFREYLAARKAVTTLKNLGISAKLARTPAALAVNGCGYGLWVPGTQGRSASAELKEAGIQYERIHSFDGKSYREITV